MSFIDGDLLAAEKHVDRSIKTYNAEMDIILANAWLLKGKIHDQKGEREEAVAAYKTCYELGNFSSAVTRAHEYSSTPFVN